MSLLLGLWQLSQTLKKVEKLLTVQGKIYHGTIRYRHYVSIGVNMESMRICNPFIDDSSLLVSSKQRDDTTNH
jgi:hypothetical protein